MSANKQTTIKEQHPEATAAYERRHLREMEALTLSQAFSLIHGWGEPKDSLGFERSVEGLQNTLSNRSQELAELTQQIKQAYEIEPPGGSLKDSLIGLKLFKSVFETQNPKIAETEKQFERSDAAHNDQMQTWAFEALSALGVIDLLSDPVQRERLALLIGKQKSQEELTTSPEGLVNRLDHYSISPRRDSTGSFESFETVDWGGTDQVLTRDVPDPQKRMKRNFDSFMSMFIDGKESASKSAKHLALSLICPAGGLVDVSALNENTMAMPMRFAGPSDRIEAAAKEAQLSSQWCASGSAALACLAAARNAPKGSPLLLALERLQALTLQADQISAQDKAHRVCEWFDRIAGERSSELALKVWGGSVPSGMKLGELETLAKFNQELWASLEGQEALGLFSIRMADTLGLELSGRDLPERAKRKMKESGLSEGGWRLLGKMDPSPKSPVAQWMGQEIEVPPELMDIQLLMFSRMRSPDEPPPSPEEQAALIERKKQEAAQRRARKTQQNLSMLSQAISACAARGLDPQSAEQALQTLLDSGRSRDAVFGLEITPPEHAQPAEIESETRAKALRIPKILGDWLSLASKNPEKARGALAAARDWTRDAEWGTWSQMPESAGWQEVMTRQKRWHEMVQKRERSEKESISWDGMSPGWNDPQTGFSAVPLTHGGMLWDEGKAMHHCVSSYAEDCERGKSRIFSIRKDGERFGTAEVSVGDGSFKVVQFRGAYNKRIEDERAWSAANAAAAQCRKAAGFFNETNDDAIARKLRERAEGALANAQDPRIAPPGAHV